MISENLNEQILELEPAQVQSAPIAFGSEQVLPYIQTNTRVQMLEVSSSETDDDEFMVSLQAKIDQMEDEDQENQVPRTKNEKVIAAPPILEVQTQQEREAKFGFVAETVTQLVHVGQLESILPDSVVLNSGNTGIILDLDQVVVTQDREVVGSVEDVFGRVETPHYRKQGFGGWIPQVTHYQWKTPSRRKGVCRPPETENCELRVPGNAKKVNLLKQPRKKGCDASNQFDEELDENERDCSDDDIEHEKKSKKNKHHKKDQTKPKGDNHHHRQMQDNKQAQINQKYNQQSQNLHQPAQQKRNETGQAIILPPQFVQIGAQYFTMLPSGIPNLLHPRPDRTQG